jgi:hypothetical protein
MASSILNSDDGVISGTSGLKSTGGDDGVLVFQSKGTETARINTDKQIVAAAGTASLPIYSTTGDTNTGIFFPAADTIAFAEGGAEAARFDSDGNFGLGVTPSAWKSNYKASQVGNATAVVGRTDNNNNYFSSNWFVNSSNQDIYQNTGFATIYTQNAGTHVWYTAPSGTAGNTISFTQAMTLDASGALSVGGTTVYNPAASRGNVNIEGATSSILNLGIGGTLGGYFFHNGTDIDLRNAKNGALMFATNGTERARIDSSGNLGIGTTTTSGVTGTILYVNGGITMPGNNDISGTSGLSPHYGSGVFAIFSGMPGSGTERMRIDSSGNLLIGYQSSNGAFLLQVNSQIFATNATISTSDGRYKEDIQSLDGALDLVAQLNPVQFSWKEHPVHNFDRSGPTVGFIAQEVQQVLANKPYLNSIIKANECVIEPEEKDSEGNVTKEAVTEEFLGIAEGNMIAILTKAIQELKAELDTVKAELATLKGTHP